MTPTWCWGNPARLTVDTTMFSQDITKYHAGYYDIWQVETVPSDLLTHNLLPTPTEFSIKTINHSPSASVSGTVTETDHSLVDIDHALKKSTQGTIKESKTKTLT